MSLAVSNKKKEAELIYAHSSGDADMLYASGFFASDPFLYFSVDGIKYIVISELEYDRAVLESHKNIVVLKADNFFKSKTKNKTSTKLIAKIQNHYNIDTFTVPESFPLGLAETLREEKIHLKVRKNKSNTPNAFFKTRAFKNDEEIYACSNGLLIAEKAMEKAYIVLAESKINSKGHIVYNEKELSSEYLKTVIGCEILKNGGVAEHTIVSCGKDSAQPHNSGQGILKANQPIVIDIFPRITAPLGKSIMSGYWGDITRTFVKGKASDMVKKMYHAVKTARDICQDIIKPGETCGIAYYKACEILESFGFKTGSSKNGSYGFFHGLGHGVGLEIHEYPSLSPRCANARLESGHIITVEPGLYYPDTGGVRLENMGVIAINGFEPFNKFPDTLEIT